VDLRCGIVVGREAVGLRVASGGVASVNAASAYSGPGAESGDSCAGTGATVSCNPEII
jgi:hypothetical protein